MAFYVFFWVAIPYQRGEIRTFPPISELVKVLDEIGMVAIPYQRGEIRTLGVENPGISSVFKTISANLLNKRYFFVGSDDTTLEKPGIFSTLASANLPQKWAFYVTFRGWRRQNTPYSGQFYVFYTVFKARYIYFCNGFYCLFYYYPHLIVLSTTFL